MNIESPVVSLVNSLIEKAVELNSSDIHLEPCRQGLRVRFRIDGLLYDQEAINQDLTLQVISRIKVLSYMDISQNRIPQDGKFFYKFSNSEIDLRVATFPCVNGEKVVIRLLNRDKNFLSLDNLGFDVQTLDQIKQFAKTSSGFFLATGPTGSGKTTTLHSMLSLINSSEKNIATLEDPVEYNIDGINQSQVISELGFNFERGIRSLLRQDPDVIMVGEIRDRETAQVAIQAALTGHLVLSTLHTNDAVGAVLRLLEMGIEPFLINASLSGVLAQRLARKLCSNCKFEQKIDADQKKYVERHKLPITKIYSSTGCDSCFGLGHKGRIGIFELLLVDNKLRSFITSSSVYSSIYNQALLNGMRPLLHDAAEKVNQGTISLAELARILT